MAAPAIAPQIIDSPTGTGRWGVVMFNNETNTFDEVISILMKSTGCGTNEAYMETWEAHIYGKTFVHFASRNECEIVAHMIGSIGVLTEVRREWQDDPA